MHHRLLLGSTALVGAGMLFASAASAQEGPGSRWSWVASPNSASTPPPTIRWTTTTSNHNYAFFMDNEIIVRANGVTDGGIRYGSKVEIEVGSDLDTGANGVSLDEAGLFFSGNFGRVELGRDDGAEDLMFVGAEDAQAGTGGIDGDTQNLGQVQFPDMGDNIKATYFTPRIAGFQLGASFAPDGDDNENGLGSTCSPPLATIVRTSIGGGVNWVGVLGPVDLTLSAVGIFANVKGGDTAQGACRVQGRTDGLRASAVCWALAASASASATTTSRDRPKSKKASSCRSAWPMASARPMSASVSSRTGTTNADNAQIFVVSGDVGLLPGVTLKGDVSYNTEDPNKRVDDDGHDGHRGHRRRRPGGPARLLSGAPRGDSFGKGAARPSPPLSIVD